MSSTGRPPSARVAARRDSRESTPTQRECSDGEAPPFSTAEHAASRDDGHTRVAGASPRLVDDCNDRDQQQSLDITPIKAVSPDCPE